jgi:hypothetical protein
MGDLVITEDSIADRYARIRPWLNERQRRAWLGNEALALGYGGIKRVAQATGVHPDTVAKGRDEIDSGDEPDEYIRRPGGGRKAATEHDPDLLRALMTLVAPATRGDPESPLVWTSASTANLARALTSAGHTVSPTTVGEILKAAGYSLQANAKTIQGRDHPDRDAQFHYVQAQIDDHRAAGDPVLSIDTKKKENIGNYKNNGREYRPAGDPQRVNDHDFPNADLGKAIPYGLYDVAANSGWVSVGTDHDTAQFAIATLRTWWNKIGKDTYPGTRRLLLCADAGGSNGYRTRLWKTELAALAAETGLAISVCHLPPGTSKWNKIEHRLFSHISMNWRGRPLTSHEVVVNTIAATTTNTGLTVHAELDTGTYPTGIKIDKAEMKKIPLTKHDFHGEWNYTITPPTRPETQVKNL